MSLDDLLKSPESGSTDAEPEIHSAAWWHARSAEELRDIINRGFRMGAAFEGASIEAERRAREAVRRTREQAEALVRREARKRLVTLGAILAAMLALVPLLWLFLR
jgi:hypothetical protein